MGKGYCIVSERGSGKKRPNKADIPRLEADLKKVPKAEQWKVHFGLVWAYHDNDEYAKALGAFEACSCSVPQEELTDLVLVVSDSLETYGEVGEALTIVEKRMRELEAAGLEGSKEMALVHLRYGQLLQRRGRFEEGMEQFQLALAFFTESGTTTEEEVRVLSSMGMMMWEKGDYDMALKFLHRARDRGMEIGFSSKLKWIFNSIGLVNYQLGNYDEALCNYRSAEERETTDNKYFLTTLYNNIGLVHHDRGDFEDAKRYYEKALRLNEVMENFVGTALNYLNLGLLSVELGDADKARDLLDEAASLCRQMKEKWIHALTAIGLARAYILKGDTKLARHNAERALGFAEEMKARESKGMALRELGLISELEGDLEEARKDLEGSVAIFEDMNNLYELAKSLEALGSFLCRTGLDMKEGRRKIENAQVIAERIGARGILRWVMDSLDRSKMVED